MPESRDRPGSDEMAAAALRPEQALVRIAVGMTARTIERRLSAAGPSDSARAIRRGVSSSGRASRARLGKRGPEAADQQRIVVHAGDAGIAFMLHMAARALQGSGVEAGGLLVAERGGRVAGDARPRLHARVRRMAGLASVAEWAMRLGKRSGIYQVLPPGDCSSPLSVNEKRDNDAQEERGRDQRRVEDAGRSQSQRSP